MDQLPAGYQPGGVASYLGNAASKPSSGRLDSLFSSPKPVPTNRRKLAARSKESTRRQKPHNMSSEKAEKKRKLKNLQAMAQSQGEPPVSEDEATSPVHGSLPPQIPEGISRHDRRAQRDKIRQIKSTVREKNQRSIFVGNVPHTVDKKRIKQLLKDCGAIESIRLRSAAPADPKLPKKAVVARKEYNSHLSALNAYVVFVSEESVDKARALNGQDLEGHSLRIDKIHISKLHNHKCSVFVGNLPFDVEEDGVREYFSDCGEIDNVRIIRDKLTRVGKGFGYVLFKDHDAVSLALKLDGKKFKNRSLRIQESSAQPRTTDAASLRAKKNIKILSLKRKFAPSEPSGDPPKKKRKKEKGEKAKKQSNSKVKAQKKKKQKHRMEKKKRQNLANILTGKKTSSKSPIKQPKTSTKTLKHKRAKAGNKS